jgi:hypothetical protein
MAKDFELLSKDYEEIKTVPTGSARVAGEFDTFNETHGFYLIDHSAADITASKEATLITKADRVKVDKTTGETWVAGEVVAWVAGTGKVSNVIGTDIYIGKVVEAAASADTAGVISFDGDAAYQKL